ncbi:hypothetical protein QNO09_09170 [Streptomyces sp. 378]|uniref:hypothetical protein n=1 Tax=Streptomyces sp. 378 TaxID=3049412 RepID=UPI0024C35B8C|nr:hypothetical protein [Streptomyces sp. 378]MDK1343469.1 hypothetical protein [Streptomyces sp. 378]
MEEHGRRDDGGGPDHGRGLRARGDGRRGTPRRPEGAGGGQRGQPRQGRHRRAQEHGRPVHDRRPERLRPADDHGVVPERHRGRPAAPERFERYQRLAAAAWGVGCGTLVLNHGTAPHPCYARIADVLVTFEGPWDTYRALPPQPRPGGPDVRLCHLVYDVPPGADPEGLARARGAVVHCAVPGTGDHPWGTLPHTLQNAENTP